MSLLFVFDAFSKADEKRHKYFKTQELKNDINRLNSVCGGCKNWMYDSCPREKHHKVSCGERICDSFEIKPSFQNLIIEKEKKVVDLNK